jgi:hypothetical protein
MSEKNGSAALGFEIEEAIIFPEAEAGTKLPSTISRQQEQKFFDNAGREYALKHNQQNLGQLGKFFGANSTAPTNIAGLVIVASILLLALTFFAPVSDAADARKLLIGVLMSALSFIFGASSKK